MQFPEYRARRTRRTDGIRRMVRETRLDSSNLCYPLFVVPGTGVAREIPSMPGQYNYSAGSPRGERGVRSRDPVGHPVRRARAQGRGRLRGLE
jgi:delta-aminolevulinic acid dehydratase/porphobilinogen synthase